MFAILPGNGPLSSAALVSYPPQVEVFRSPCNSSKSPLHSISTRGKYPRPGPKYPDLGGGPHTLGFPQQIQVLDNLSELRIPSNIKGLLSV